MLRTLPKVPHPDLLLGPENYSDAGVFRLREDLAIVQTTDFFPPIVDDPFSFGQIAAANSLSDCYALGARPVTCLNIVAFPTKDLPIDVLNEILAGGASKVAESGAVIVGGHSIRDAEVKYGLAVTGIVHPDEFVTNAGARPGDRLILTKPIGSGTMATAAKNGTIGEDVLSEAIRVMIELNAPAADVARLMGARAVTDVTGFGLFGHAFQMAEASGVGMTIFAGRVPLIGPTLQLARQGIGTSAWKSTLESLGPGFRAEGLEEAQLIALSDAQTSGGLLMAISAERVGEALQELSRRGVKGSAEIGEVMAGPPVLIAKP